MSFRLPLDGKGPLGRSEEDIRADNDRFRRLLEAVPFDEAREKVKAFLHGTGRDRLREALAEPLKLADDFIAQAKSSGRAEFIRDVSALLEAGSGNEPIDSKQLQIEAEHVAHELLRHLVELARSAVQLAQGVPVLLNANLMPEFESSNSALWNEDLEDSLSELRNHLPVDDESVPELLRQAASQLTRLATGRVVELPGGVDLLWCTERPVLRARVPPSPKASSQR